MVLHSCAIAQRNEGIFRDRDFRGAFFEGRFFALGIMRRCATIRRMNIEVQSCGLLILTVLLVIILRDKNLELQRSKTFFAAMLSCMAAIVMDIFSVIAIVYASQGMFPRSAALIVCKLYLVLLIYVGYRGFLYAALEFLNERSGQKIRNFYRILFVTGALAIIVLPIDYYSEGRVVYSHGPSAMAAYAYAFILFASTIYIACVDKEGTSKRRRRIILIWQICWAVAAAIQFLVPSILLVSFAAAAGIGLVYSELESPNELIDRTTGEFNYGALQEYLADLYKQKRHSAAMNVMIHYGAGDRDLELEVAALRRIANFLDEKGSYVFRERDEGFVVIYEDEEALYNAYNRASKELEALVDMPIRFSYALIPDISIFDNADEFLGFQHYNFANMSIGSKKLVGKEDAEEMRNHFRLRDAISWALENGGVEVYYQPIYSMSKKTFNFAEALLRVHDSEGNMIMPQDLIPIAEESGLIIPLGTEVFRQVCELLSQGEVRKLGIEMISVNLSMKQFTEDEPAGFAHKIMSEYGINPEWIYFEITESADPATQQNILINMEKLNKEGVRFALDDFGTGRSNVDYLVTMPVNVIKFDFEFTHWYFKNERSRKIVLGVTDTIKKMGLDFVMEGVETKEEFDAMESIGASYIQGFYFSKPIPKDEFIEFLKANA